MRAYLELGKPRIALMSALTTALGWFLAGGVQEAALYWTVTGAALAALACGTLNQWMEIEQDRLMTRTQKRPLPSGRVTPDAALAFGLTLAVAGLGLLWAKAGRLPCLITLATLIGYVGIYTPLKRLTPQATWIGAAAGATTPLIGWAAVRGELSAQAWTLFAIQFLWQIPHFLAIFWLYREDYKRAGFRVMPVVDATGGSTAVQISIHCLTMLGASLLPHALGMAGLVYAAGALALSTAFLGLGMRASWTLAVVDTRRLFLASLAYLPILFSLLLIGA